jgi:hypothetical protein
VTPAEFQGMREYDATYYKKQMDIYKQGAAEGRSFDLFNYPQPAFYRSWISSSWLSFLEAANRQKAVGFASLFPLMSTVGYLRRHPTEPCAVKKVIGPLPCDFNRDAFRQTKVEFYPQDPLMVATALRKSATHNPLVLVPVHADEPCGHFEKGDARYETDLCIRTNYGSTMSAKLGSLVNRSAMQAFRLPVSYPICGSDASRPIENEYGGLYISSLVMFRGPRESGFGFLSTAQRDLCVFASTPYTVTRQAQAKEEEIFIAAHLRRKIETFLSVAFNNRHDSVIFGGFGDDTLAVLTAKVIHAALTEFSGCFAHVGFAIEDQAVRNEIHNVFKLDPFVPCSKDQLRLSSNKPICPKQTKCPDFGAHHHQAYVHVPVCPTQMRCERKHDTIHCALWLHSIPCEAEGLCTLFEDAGHCERFLHPKRCDDWERCPILDDQHALSLWHPLICPEGRTCPRMGAGFFLLAFFSFVMTLSRLPSSPCPDTVQGWPVLSASTERGSPNGFFAPVH